MRTLHEQLSGYATYHRDRRNIATHFFGVPMIVVAVFAFLARPGVTVSGVPLSPALFALAGAILFYLLLDVWFGVAMLLALVPAFAAGTWLGAQGTAIWLGGAVGLFVVGWAIQFVGHYFEGRKPAFVDDLVGLLVGPLFIVAETMIALGLRADVRDAILAKAGPTRRGESMMNPGATH